MKKAFIFVRNLTTNSPVDLKSYDFYFYSEELTTRVLEDSPYKEVLSGNLGPRVDLVCRILKELEDYVGKPITGVNEETFREVMDRHGVSHSETYLPPYETSKLENLVSYVWRPPNLGSSHVCSTFTKFHRDLKRGTSSETYVPRLKSEFQVLSRLKRYLDNDLKGYLKKRSKLDPLTSGLAPYLSLGVMSIETLLSILEDSTEDSQDKREFHRQVCWATYSKIKRVPPPKSLPVLEGEREKKYLLFCSGSLPEESVVEVFVNREVNKMVRGDLISNRSRLILSYYLIKRLGVYWEYGEHFFRSGLIDYHPKINFFNWYSQNRNRFLSSYNLERQLEVYK